MKIFIIAVVFGFFLVTILGAKHKKFKCDTCKYMVCRDRNCIRYNTCRIYNVPAELDECKTYDEVVK